MCHLVLLSTLRQDQLYLNYSLLIFVLLKNVLSKIQWWSLSGLANGKKKKKGKRIGKVYQFSLWLNWFEMLIIVLPIILLENMHLGNFLWAVSEVWYLL